MNMVLRTHRERLSTSKGGLHGCEFVDIIVVDPNTLKTDINVVELRFRIMDKLVTSPVGTLPT
jgi:hypothetical protein